MDHAVLPPDATPHVEAKAEKSTPSGGETSLLEELLNYLHELLKMPEPRPYDPARDNAQIDTTPHSDPRPNQTIEGEPILPKLGVNHDLMIERHVPFGQIWEEMAAKEEYQKRLNEYFKQAFPWWRDHPEDFDQFQHEHPEEYGQWAHENPALSRYLQTKVDAWRREQQLQQQQ
jgi:hypothetical protein